MAISKLILNGITQMDVTQNTVTADTLLLNETATKANGLQVIGNYIPNEKPKNVNFIDYDGTPLYSYTTIQWYQMSALPPNPSHTGLTAQGWNWTKAQIDAQLAAAPDSILFIGQMYITTNGATEIDINLINSNSIALGLTLQGTISINWGDNSTSQTYTEYIGDFFAEHTYNSAGFYTISISVQNGTFSFNGIEYGPSVLYIAPYSNSSLVACSQIQHIRLGTNLEIPNWSFNNLTNLLDITIPSYISTMGENAFHDCRALKSITIPSNCLINASTQIFGNCYSLTNIACPNIGLKAGVQIQGCYNLQYITVSASYSAFVDTNAFYQYVYIKHVTFLKDIEHIDDDAFNQCENLTSIAFPNTLLSIGNYAFCNCYNLKSISIPNSVTTLGEDSFGWCYNLSSIIIGESVQTLPHEVFICTNIQSLTIPASVTEIDNEGLSASPCLQEIHMLKTSPPTLDASAFDAIEYNIKIYVPYSSNHSILNAYKSATNWSDRANYIYEEPNL